MSRSATRHGSDRDSPRLVTSAGPKGHSAMNDRRAREARYAGHNTFRTVTCRTGRESDMDRETGQMGSRDRPDGIARQARWDRETGQMGSRDRPDWIARLAGLDRDPCRP